MVEINPTLQPAQKPPPADPSLTHLRRLLWLLGGLAMVAAFALLGGWWLRPPELHGVLLQSPRQAQDFTLAGPDGTPVALSDFRGKFVLLAEGPGGLYLCGPRARYARADRHLYARL
jgi:hypothetical protein